MITINDILLVDVYTQARAYVRKIISFSFSPTFHPMIILKKIMRYLSLFLFLTAFYSVGYANDHCYTLIGSQSSILIRNYFTSQIDFSPLKTRQWLLPKNRYRFQLTIFSNTRNPNRQSIQVSSHDPIHLRLWFHHHISRFQRQLNIYVPVGTFSRKSLF